MSLVGNRPGHPWAIGLRKTAGGGDVLMAGSHSTDTSIVLRNSQQLDDATRHADGVWAT